MAALQPGTLLLKSIDFRQSANDPRVNLVATQTGELLITKQTANSTQLILSAGVDDVFGGAVSANIILANTAHIGSDLTLASGSIATAGDLSVNSARITTGFMVGGRLEAAGFEASSLIIEGANGSLNVEGHASFASALSVSGDITIEHDLSAISVASIGGDIRVDADALLDSALHVHGATTAASGSLTTDADLIVSGGSLSIGSHLVADSGTLSVGGSTSIASVLVLPTSNLTVLDGANLAIAGSAALSSTVSVGGSTTLAGHTDVAGDLTVLSSGGMSVISGGVFIPAAIISIAGNTHAVDIDAHGTLDISGGNLVGYGDAHVDGSLDVGLNTKLSTAILENPDGTPSVNLIITGADTDMSGSLFVDGVLSVGSTGHVESGLSTSSTLTVNASRLTVEADSTIGTSLLVHGTSTFASTADFDDTLTIPLGNVSIGGSVVVQASSISVAGSTTITSTEVHVASQTSITGSLTTSEDIAIDGTLHVDNLLAFAGNISIAADMHVGGDLIVVQDLSVGGTSTVLGSTDVSIEDRLVAIGVESDESIVNVGMTFGAAANRALLYHHPYMAVYDSATDLGEMRSASIAVGISIEATPTSSVYFGTTDAMQLPAGTTAQQPSPAENGMMRYNTTLDIMEAYVAGAWSPIGGARTPDGATRIDVSAPSIQCYVENTNVFNFGSSHVDGTNLSVGVLHVDVVQVADPTEPPFSFDNDIEFIGNLLVNGRLYVSNVFFIGGGASLVDSLTLNTSILEASANPVESGAIYDALLLKEDVIVYDTAPVEGSTNAITSGNAFTAIEAAIALVSTLEPTPVEMGTTTSWKEDLSPPVQFTIAWDAAETGFTTDYTVTVSPTSAFTPPRQRITKNVDSVTVTFYEEDGSAAANYALVNVDVAIVYDGQIKADISLSGPAKSPYFIGTSTSLSAYDPSVVSTASGVLYPTSGPSDIPASTFANDANITGLDLTNAANLSSIGTFAFLNVDLTGALDLHVGHTYGVAANAFQGVSIDGTLTVPSNLIPQGDNIFRQAFGLTDLIIEDGFTPNGKKYMFQQCASLQSVRLPASMSSRLNNLNDFFKDCVSLRTIELESESTIGANSSFNGLSVQADIFDVATTDRGLVGTDTFSPGVYSHQGLSRYAYYRPLRFDGFGLGYETMGTQNSRVASEFTFVAWVKANVLTQRRTIMSLVVGDSVETGNSAQLEIDGQGNLHYSTTLQDPMQPPTSLTLPHTGVSTSEYFAVGVTHNNTTKTATLHFKVQHAGSLTSASTTTTSAFAANNISTLRLGCPVDTAATNKFWDGEIAEARFYHQVLGETDMNAFFASRVGDHDAVIPPGIESFGSSRPALEASPSYDFYYAARGADTAVQYVTTDGSQTDALVIGEKATTIPGGTFQNHQLRHVDFSMSRNLGTVSASAFASTLISQSSISLPPNVVLDGGSQFKLIANARGTVFVPSTVTFSGGQSHFESAPFEFLVMAKAATAKTSVSMPSNFFTSTPDAIVSAIVANNFDSMAPTALNCASLERFATLQPIITQSDSFHASNFGSLNGTSVAPGCYIHTGSGNVAHFDIGGVVEDFRYVAPNSPLVLTYNATAPGNTGVVVIGPGLASIPGSHFQGHTNITGIDFGVATSLTTIGTSAFESCSGISYISLPSHVDGLEIGASAFQSCGIIRDVYIPSTSTLNSTGSQFKLNTGLINVTFGPAASDADLVIPTSCFQGCAGLTSADLGNRFSIVGHNAFDGTALSRLTVGRTFKVESANAFGASPLAPFFDDANRVYPAGIYEWVVDSVVFTPFPVYSGTRNVSLVGA